MSLRLVAAQELAHAQVHIWLARDPQLRSAALLEQLAKMLSPEERARVAQMHFAEDRHQQLVTRGMVRSLLSGYVPEVAPADWRFEINAHGRPRIAEALAAARDLQFNLAHTRGLVVMAVARSAEIGVDVERFDSRTPMGVARRYFSKAEVAALDELPADQQPQRFRRLWTLKESYLKAIGTGVAGGLETMTFDFGADGVHFERIDDPAASRWVFRDFSVADEFLLALAYLDRTGDEPPEVTLYPYPPESA